MTAAPPEKPAHKRVPRWRRILVVVFLVLGCVLAPLSVFAVWTKGTLLSTDQYVDTIAPLAEDPVVTDRIAARSVEALFENVDVDAKITEVLPEQAAVIAPAVSQAVQNLARDVVERFLSSDAFQTLWRELNRRAHTQVQALLTGEGGRVVNGQVVVQLGPVVEKVRTRLEGLGLDIFDDLEESGERASNQFVLFQSEDIETVQGGVDFLQKLAVLLPILTLLFLAAAVALSGDRRRTLVRAGLGLAFSMAILLIAFNLLRGVFVDVFRPEGREAGGAVYDQLLSFLRLAVRSLFALGVVVAIGAWIAGPGRFATRTREGALRLGDGITGKSDSTAGAPSGFALAVAHHRVPLRVLVVGLGALVLMVLSHPTGITVLVIAILVLIGLAAIEVVARSAGREAMATVWHADSQ